MSPANLFYTRLSMARWRTSVLGACVGALLIQFALCDPAWLDAYVERVLKDGKPASLPPPLVTGIRACRW
jgi:hypothetical protein